VGIKRYFSEPEDVGDWTWTDDERFWSIDERKLKSTDEKLKSIDEKLPTIDGEGNCIPDAVQGVKKMHNNSDEENIAVFQNDSEETVQDDQSGSGFVKVKVTPT
jgi:hypothetical protein